MARRAPRLLSPTVAALMLTTALTSPVLAQPAWDGGQKSGFSGGPPPAVRPMQASPGVGAPSVGVGVPDEDLRIATDDPPVVVGRIARSSGTASLRFPGAEEWVPAGLNSAINEGTALWTEPGSRMALEVAQNRLFLDGGTALQVDELDEEGMRATLAGGSLFLRLFNMNEFGLMELVTPEARFATAMEGRYLVEAAAPDGSRPGRIVVIEGAAEVTPAGDGATPIPLGPGDAVRLLPGAPLEPERWVGSATPLMGWALSTEPRRPIPQAARGMTGIAELASVGRWDRSPEFGDVWYPPVAEDWTPYRDGQWVWRDPWGWTWVDAQPWGFAPSHYGRWVQAGPRWAWAPAPVPVADVRVRPAWAPALVAFFGGVAVGSALNARPVGWVPLAPREPFYPWYRASPRYVQRVNIRQVVNVVNVRNTWIERGRDIRWEESWRRDRGVPVFYDRRLDGFRNVRAAVQVPDRVFLNSLPVRAEARRLRLEEARRADFFGGLPLRPVPETRGFTLRSAERLGYRVEDVRPRLLERPRFAEPPERLRAALAAEARRDAIERRQDALDDRRRDLIERRQDAAQERRQDVLEDRRRDALERRQDALQDRREDLRDQQRRESLERRQDAQQERREDLRDQQRRDAIERRQDAAQERRQDLQEQQRREALERRQDAQQERREGDRLREVEERRQRAEELRRRQEEIARRQAEVQRDRQRDAQDRRLGADESDRQRRLEELRQRQGDARAREAGEARRQQAEELRRQREEQFRRQQEGAARQGAERQQAEQLRRQQEQQQRVQADQARRQQAEQARREQERAQRQEAEQARRQQDIQQRQQQEQARREQERAQRQATEQAQRQAQEQARRQQEQQARQQAEQARRQQDIQQRQQAEQARREQERAQRQAVEQAQRQAQEQARRQAEQQARQQAEQARRQQEVQQRQQEAQARRAEAEARRQERQNR